ncbi:hypothetical protein BV898_10461 [Hypsibius exemplaris]|uniref:Uncharacterized protein n=1 Tax=Hypsibius exemplaris TaxID=2072580 RepID=A0A1W0WJG5_HYPEX|nr:hypothetical protein BV898_10461 [Hypsibius exemplaris]
MTKAGHAWDMNRSSRRESTVSNASSGSEGDTAGTSSSRPVEPWRENPVWLEVDHRHTVGRRASEQPPRTVSPMGRRASEQPRAHCYLILQY